MCKNRSIMYATGMLFVFFFWGKAFPEDIPRSHDRLTLQEAIETGLRHHPSFSAAQGISQAQEARIGTAKANLYPQLNLFADYRRATANFAPSSQASTNLNQIISSNTSNDSFNNYGAALSLEQRIFDFGKTGAEIAFASEVLRASRWEEEAVRQNIVLDVKVAYFGLLQARSLVKVNEETVQQFEQHLEQAQEFFRVGTRPKFDVTKAEVDRTNAQLGLIVAKNAAEVAQVTLASAMGVPERKIGAMEETLVFQRFDIAEEEALQEALTHLPALLSLSAQRKAAQASVRAAGTKHFPVLSGKADYTYRGQEFPLVWNWNVGVNLTFPIFSGYLTQSQVAEARASLSEARANEEGVRQTIYLEVRKAYLNLIEAEERVRISDLVVRQAEENLELANGRFQVGVGNSVERTDAQVLLTDAKTSQIRALYDYTVAEARLEKAVGRR